MKIMTSMTPTRKRISSEQTHWRSSDDFLDDNLHDQLPSVQEIRMSAASSGRMTSGGGGGGGSGYVHETKKRCGPVAMIVMVAVGICALIIGLSVGLTGDKNTNVNQEATGETTTYTSGGGSGSNAGGESAPGPAPQASRLDRTIALLSQVSDPKEFEDVYTPRRRAARWMAEEDPAQMMIPTTVGQGQEFIERYVAVLIYFSMNGPMWDVQLDFLSEKHICEWQATYPAGDGGASRKVGIGCDDDFLVSDFHLRKYIRVFALSVACYECCYLLRL